MNNSEELSERKLHQIQLFIYFIPIIGVIPALWTLYRSNKTKPEKQVSRVSINLAIAWIIAYSLLWLGANNSSEVLSFRLLYLNGLLTSGYFLACFLMMFSLWRGKLPNFPNFTGKN